MGCVPLPLLYTNFRPNEMPMRRRVTEAAEALTFISRLGAFTNSRWYEPVQRGVLFAFLWLHLTLVVPVSPVKPRVGSVSPKSPALVPKKGGATENPKMLASQTAQVLLR